MYDFIFYLSDIWYKYCCACHTIELEFASYPHRLLRVRNQETLRQYPVCPLALISL